MKTTYLYALAGIFLFAGTVGAFAYTTAQKCGYDRWDNQDRSRSQFMGRLNESDRYGQRDGYHNGMMNGYTAYPNDFVPGKELVNVEKIASEATTLSQSEIDALVYMREEEKLAHDVYATLGEKWGDRIFENIATSESTHTEAVKALLDAYKIGDPVTDNSRGVFTNETFKNLYSELTTKGLVSRAEAFKVGAYIEDLDIVDLKKNIDETKNENITAVYSHLLQGSENHIRAFTRQIERETGSSYTPSFLTTDELASILARDVRGGMGRF